MNIINIKDVVGCPYSEECSANDFLDKIPKLFNRANDEILISTSFSKEFYDNKKLKEAILNAIKRGVNIKIISDYDADTPPEWVIENKSIGLAKSKKKILHVMVVDRKHLRIETIHDKGEYDNVKNTIFYNNPRLIATKWYFEFMKLWSSSIVEIYAGEKKKEQQEKL